ncbi:MAG: tetratricopeptide repeat protein [Pseudomonas sp.]
MRAIPVLLLMCCVTGCAALPDYLRSGKESRPNMELGQEVERLLDQPLIDPLTRFLHQHAAEDAGNPQYQRIARERDSRCRAIGTRYDRQAPTRENLNALRSGYAYSCPDQVDAFARRVPEHQPVIPGREPTNATTLPAQASDCYLLFAIRNYQQALPACTAAAQAGDGKSQHHLASLLRNNRALTEALHWAEQSAANGYPPGQLLLAEFYQRGHGESADRVRALSLIEMAADQGLAAAQYQAGMAWLNGMGTEPDRSVARRWLERAAGQDNLAAQLQLAELHFNGSEENGLSARQWQQRAAALGSATAQYRLGVSYLEGSGGPADPLEAYVWLSLALLNGEQRARSGVAELASRLSPGQVEEARQRINAAPHGRPY